MVLLMALLLLPWDQPTPGVSIDGKATYYSARLLEEVASNRGMELGDHIGFAAMNRKGDLGKVIYVEYLGKDKELYGKIIGPLLVVDVAQEGAHYEEREGKNLIVELSFEQAMEWNMKGPIPVRVYLENPFPVTREAI